MLGFMTAGCVAILATAAVAAPLARATGSFVEVKARGAAESFSFEKGIVPDDGAMVIRSLRGRYEGVSAVWRVPGRPSTFLAAGSRKQEDSRDLGGLRLLLVEKDSRGISVLGESTGSADSYILRPVVFSGAGRTLVLAEMGTEYSWGLRVFEVDGSELRDLGSIDAGVIGEDGQEGDPTPFARVTIEGGKVVVTFDSDLSIGTGDSDAPLALKPVVFRQGAKGFELHRPRFKRRTAP
jgi:hypothetical protein